MPAFTPQPQGITAHWPLLIYSDVTRKFTLGAEAHGERGARGYTGGLGAEPPAGPRGRAPGQGSGGLSPPEAESFFRGCTSLGLGKLAPF